jgi:hypothetical protein
MNLANHSAGAVVVQASSLPVAESRLEARTTMNRHLGNRSP